VEAGEAAEALECIDKRGGVVAVQDEPTKAAVVKDVLDSVNGKSFWLVLSALAEMRLEKVSRRSRLYRRPLSPRPAPALPRGDCWRRPQCRAC